MMASQRDTRMWRGRLRAQLTPEHWPAADKAAWASAMACSSILDFGGGRAAGWSKASCRNCEHAYGQWLAWLVSHAMLDPATEPWSRLTYERVAAYVADLQQGRATTTVWSYMQALAMFCSATAPEADTAWLWEVVSVLHRSVAPSGRKPARVVPSDELFAHGIDLMETAARTASTRSARAAAQFRDGLMISLLAARPLRIKNLTSIEIGVQLQSSKQRHYLRFCAPEMKTRRAYEVDLPPALMPFLETYLSTYRPILLAQHGQNKTSADMDLPGMALWISEWGTRMAEPTIFAHIADRTRRKFGKSISPHLFRDCVATTIAHKTPAHVAITPTIMGHTSMRASESFYNHARSSRAAETYQADVAAMLRDSRRKAKYVRRPPSGQR